MKQKHFIDSHKGVTALFIVLLMAYYDQWHNPTAWIYLALHGAYGFLWVLKSHLFPDGTWEQPTNLGFGLVIWGGLSLYWAAPWLLMAGGVRAPAPYLAMCIALYSFGLFLHFTSDMQKYITLQLQPGRLISGGLFAFSRNINYFGELLIYAGFGLLAMHWLPVVILMSWVSLVWLPRMLKKDRSLARYPEFASYRKRTKLFIPYVL